MRRKSRSSSAPKKRRTTVTLPADSLLEVQRIARARNVSLSTLIAEGLDEVIRRQRAAERADEILEGYKKAFSGLSDDEMSILNGIILEPENER